MQINTLIIKQLGRFTHLEAALAPTNEAKGNVTVFIGNNGAGKTSILKALATSLSWFVARVRSEKGSGSPIPEEVILNGSPSAMVHITLFDAQGLRTNAIVESSAMYYRWSLAKTVRGKKAVFTSSLNDVSRLADIYRTSLTENEKANLPLIAFYPVERVVLDVPLKN